MKNHLAPRILITLLGVALILMAASEALLGYAGESVTAVLTSIRRVGGERPEAIPGRYSYDISYTFNLPNGKEISGSTKKVGDSVFLKTDGSSTVQVRYLTICPHINTLEGYAAFGWSQVVLILVGVFLIYFMNSKNRNPEE